MLLRSPGFWQLVAAVAIAGFSPTAVAVAGDKDTAKGEGKIAGIMFDFDLKANWITAKADGEDEVVKYRYDASDKKLTEVLGKTVFPASRVQLTYSTQGDGRQLTSIRRQVLKASGIATGTVVQVHNGFWIELKPKHGLSDAYAPGANYNDQAFMAKLRALKPGDSVTIRFTTDFERHRIETLQKILAAGERNKIGSGHPTTPAKTDR